MGEKEKDVSETAYLSCELRKRVSDELCPDGSWRLSNVMEKLLRLQMNSLPQGTVSEEETMYPTSNKYDVGVEFACQLSRSD